MEITYYGHSCFLVKGGGKDLLFDPYVTPNELASHIDVDAIPADNIFCSHAHFDHVTDVERIANRTGARVFGCWELYQWFNSKGLKNTFPINPGGKFNFDFGTVKAVIAQHSASLPDGSYGGVASGFVFATNDGNFYYSGDTALTLDMQLIPRFTKVDFAVFPIGDGLTMGVEEAIEAAKMVGVTKVMGVHYDTFGFIVIDKEKAVKDFEKAGIKLFLPAIGETFTI
ncbi:metal-dependent hydrolase [Flavobacterium sp. MAH-1]|uniref:Metal-dependent hydrolase n=1 Tax=Flavobacterium agri TaxID=2743471 RepID=A0A7Y8Y3S7_9FLAO|nr:metal-dependent hydrolase [Flavobacterium agri]NUY81967.1 metal-dependent hydrolase [Flavobacterium agri]NYA71991.1 metal-dependent hydrolase [Flavobacterium agri]